MNQVLSIININKFGKTILIVEQKVREVLEVCHHVYSRLGKIAYSEKLESIISKTTRKS